MREGAGRGERRGERFADGVDTSVFSVYSDARARAHTMMSLSTRVVPPAET